MSDLKNEVEALLFSSGKAMSEVELATLTNNQKKNIIKAISELVDNYKNRDSALMVVSEGESWKLIVREKYMNLVVKIISDTELSKSVLETLSVIAWKSPVLQSEVIKIRTNKAYDHIKELVDRDFLIKEKEGRSYKLRVTEKFFEYFDVVGSKGIKEAFKDVKIPVKQEETLGNLEVVKADTDSEEKNLRTKEIFGPHNETLQVISESEVVKIEKSPKLAIDNEFLDEINRKIEEISKRNDEFDNDDVFKKRKEKIEIAVQEGIEERSEQEKQVSEEQTDDSEEIVDETKDEYFGEEKSKEKDTEEEYIDEDNTDEDVPSKMPEV
ncbi:MAG: SMC-Scp complex subunit ScpB [Nanoarchaeota archaeon]|nr:SMC-Scp complex subunit ScpB [Nanoarchaeota archaeon]MBU1031184.1 SMC-Scp complex subunit ScpB [Nanoarchaeota archaeon]